MSGLTTDNTVWKFGILIKVYAESTTFKQLGIHTNPKPVMQNITAIEMANET